VRRALSEAESNALIQAAARGGIVFAVSGPDRAMLYRLAALTGFRRKEPRSLTPKSFDLDGNPPTVTVRAAYRKHRRDDIQPIPEALAALLRPWLTSRPSVAPLFGNLTKHTAAMIRADLADAAIPYANNGATADFHALRHSYPTALAKSNAPVKVG
jgi:integrase